MGGDREAVNAFPTQASLDEAVNLHSSWGKGEHGGHEPPSHPPPPYEKAGQSPTQEAVLSCLLSMKKQMARMEKQQSGGESEGLGQVFESVGYTLHWGFL